MKILSWVIASSLLFLSDLAHCSSTKVGNGDEGADLEETVPIVEGKIVETKQKAIHRQGYAL